MVGGKLPLLPPAKIPDLTAGASALVIRRVAAAILRVPCVGSQKPFPADGAFSRCVFNRVIVSLGMFNTAQPIVSIGMTLPA